MYLITLEGFIIEKPDEYRRNRRLLKEHYKSSSPKKKGRKNKSKGKKDEKETDGNIDHENHSNFIKDVRGKYEFENEDQENGQQNNNEEDNKQDEQVGNAPEE